MRMKKTAPCPDTASQQGTGDLCLQSKVKYSREWESDTLFKDGLSFYFFPFSSLCNQNPNIHSCTGILMNLI